MLVQRRSPSVPCRPPSLFFTYLARRIQASGPDLPDIARSPYPCPCTPTPPHTTPKARPHWVAEGCIACSYVGSPRPARTGRSLQGWEEGHLSLGSHLLGSGPPPPPLCDRRRCANRRLWPMIIPIQCMELPLFPCKPALTPKGLWVQVFDEADRPPAAAQHNHSRLAGRRE